MRQTIRPRSDAVSATPGRILERAPRRLHCEVDVLRVTRGDVGDDSPSAGSKTSKVSATACFHPLAVDQHQLALCQERRGR